MADNYLQFSESLLIQTEEQEAWLLRLFGEGRDAAEEGDVEKYAAFTRIWGLAGISESAMYGWPGFGYEFMGSLEESDRRLWIWDGGAWGDIENAVDIIQAFMKQFRPDGVFRITWAASCSKPRIGEFYGGGVVISANRVKWINVNEETAKYIKKYHKGKVFLS